MEFLEDNLNALVDVLRDMTAALMNDHVEVPRFKPARPSELRLGVPKVDKPLQFAGGQGCGMFAARR